MKSKFFAHSWRSDFSHKAYGRYLQSCVEDDILSPREKDIPQQHSQPEWMYYCDYYSSEKLKVTKCQAAEEKTFTISVKAFERFWMKIDKTSLKTKVLDYLTLGDIARLMRTCKSFNKLDEESVWAYLIERDLKTNFQRQKFFGSPDYVKNLYKSIHFSLTNNQILKSPSMYQHKTPRFANLAYRLLDFKEVKSMKTIEKLCGYLFDNVTITLMLSFLPEKSEFVVWIVDERKGKLNHIEAKKWSMQETQKIISAKFLSEDFVIVQVQAEDDANYEISLVGLNEQEEEDHRILIQYDSGDCLSTAIAAEIISQDEKTIKLKGIEPLELSYSFDQKERILFYNKENEKILVFNYNIKTRKIEAVKVENREKGLLEIFQGTSEVFLVDENLDIYTVNLSTNESAFVVEKIFSHGSSEFEVATNQYMTYHYAKHQGAEFLVVVRNMEFYYINLQTKQSRKILRFLEDLNFDPFNLHNYQNSCVDVYNNSLKSWNVFEDVLVVMLENADLVIVKLDPTGQIISFGEEKALLDTFPPNEPRFEKLKSYDNMIGTQIPPILLMNHGYLVIVTFPRLETSFNVFIFSLTENLICRNVSNWKYYSYGGKHFHRTSWWICGADLFGGDAEQYFLSRSVKQNYCSSDIVKFEDNKLLFKVGLNLFFDLQSSFNHILQPAPKKFFSIENKFLTFQISIPESVKPQEKSEDDEKNIKLKKEKLRKNNNMPNYIKYPKENKNHKLESVEDEETPKGGKGKKTVKQEIRDLFARENRCNLAYVAPLSSIKGTIPFKEYYLKKLNKKKDKIKKKYQRVEEEP